MKTVLPIVLIAISCLAAVPSFAESAPGKKPFLRAEGSKLFLGEKEYRAIGINMPYASRVFTGQMQGVATSDCFLRPPEEIAKWVKEAAENGFSFLRFFGYPNTPAEIDWYLANKEEYWKKMDEFFAMCREADLKLIPSLGIYPNFHHTPHTGEKTSAILDPTSQTHRQVYGYVREMVTRYKDDPNVLMWEISNEVFLKADVTPAGSKRPEDLMTFDQLKQMYREATDFIKAIDPNHLVTSGDCHVRHESMSRRRGTKLRMDTLREHLVNQLDSQSDPIDVASLHYYGPQSAGYDGKFSFKDAEGNGIFPGNQRVMDAMLTSVRAFHLADVPVFLGELGQQYPFLNEDPKASWLIPAVNALDQEGVSLVALWVWRFPEQPVYTFDPETNPELVKQARGLNRKYGTLPSSCKIKD